MRYITTALVFVALFSSTMIVVAQIAGTVVDGNAQPVAGARVSLQASDVETTSDASGGFVLPGLTGDVVIAAAWKGYFYGVALVARCGRRVS